MNYKYLLMAMAFLMIQAVAAEQSHKLTRSNQAGLGIDGYSPVSYFEKNMAELGSAEFEYTFEGIKYRLTNQHQFDLFSANPLAYLPAHGGWCSLMLSGSGNMTPANPTSFRIIEGKLLLFWDGQYKGQPVNGLNNWHSKTKGSTKTENKRLKNADKTWQKLLTGKKKAQILIFDESDKIRLNASTLKQAKKQY